MSIRLPLIPIALISTCLDGDPAKRPSFKDVLAKLGQGDVVEFDAERSWTRMRELVRAQAHIKHVSRHNLASTVAAAGGRRASDSVAGGAAAATTEQRGGPANLDQELRLQPMNMDDSFSEEDDDDYTIVGTLGESFPTTKKVVVVVDVDDACEVHL